MPTIKQIDECISKKAKPELSESWDNDGIMLCGNLNKEVKSVLISLDLNSSVAKYAKDNGVDLIITHHPFIFNPIKNITGSKYNELNLLFSGNIDVLSYHTRLDSADGGMNDVLAEKLGLLNVIPFGGEEGNIGRVGFLPKKYSIGEFSNLLKEKLSCGTIRASFPKDKEISKVAVIGGGGKSYLSCAKDSGADAFVSADFSHNTFIDAKEEDIAVFDCGHYYTENVIVEALSDYLKNEFNDLKIEGFDTKSPYINL